MKALENGGSQRKAHTCPTVINTNQNGSQKNSRRNQRRRGRRKTVAAAIYSGAFAAAQLRSVLSPSKSSTRAESARLKADITKNLIHPARLTILVSFPEDRQHNRLPIPH
jgi:hypothetical protein